ncbi:ABC transporter ATP-binding protein [Pseudalkalibacillus decolorationis]|uniref:ABC transporter ATP-binding protein n=1 Tax=Pseudalkalibacillus decolorationis TaxID=163879 RepID=UPI00214943FF|nr:ABC transporter ATP-binding protein [Pseudalkalibacillus decolorationis]
MEQYPLLKLIEISKRIGKHQILSDINLEIGHGEIVGLLGRNGSGKTTLIRTIVGLVKANKGKVIINGTNLNSDFERAIQHVGAIVENPEFYTYLTGYQNLQQYASMYGNISDERVEDVIELVNLVNAIDDKVGTYSLGMRQRLGIAQAILHQPKLLILDEPTNGLDPMGIREFRSYVKTLCEKENVSIIIASHLLREIEDLCDQVVIIQSGKIVQVKQFKHHDVSMKKVRFELLQQEKARSLLHKNGFSVEISPNGVVLELKKEQIPGAIRVLVNNGIDVFSVNSIQASLEDAFFKILGETSHD